MGLPSFLLRKLYARGSLRATDDGGFTFALQNPLGTATLISPPDIVINGIRHDPAAVAADTGVDLAAISRDHPFRFAKGDKVTLSFKGHLLRGGNRIHVAAYTKEWGELDIFAEETAPPYGDEEE
ncbi:MAG: hypothetical protein ACPGQL_10235 [Thermoplasmatota archaeon]